MKLNVAATFGQKSPSSGHTSRSCTGGSVRRTNQGKNAMLLASPRRQGVPSVRPQRYQGFDPTFAGGIILNYTPEAICHKCIVRTQLFWADNDPDTPKKLVVVTVVHHISCATARAGPSKHVGGLMGTVDVVVAVIAVVYHISWPAVRASPSKHMGRLMGWAERPI